MRNTTLKPLLNRWYSMLCESGCNSKTKVRKEIEKVLKKIDVMAEPHPNKNYKVYFKNKELRDFKTLEDCLNCIEIILNIDSNRFKFEDFKIYVEVGEDIIEDVLGITSIPEIELIAGVIYEKEFKTTHLLIARKNNKT